MNTENPSPSMTCDRARAIQEKMSNMTPTILEILDLSLEDWLDILKGTYHPTFNTSQNIFELWKEVCDV